MTFNIHETDFYLKEKNELIPLLEKGNEIEVSIEKVVLNNILIPNPHFLKEIFSIPDNNSVYESSILKYIL